MCVCVVFCQTDEHKPQWGGGGEGVVVNGWGLQFACLT